MIKKKPGLINKNEKGELCANLATNFASEVQIGEA